MSTQAPATFQQRWLLGLVQQHTDWNCVLAYAVRLGGVLSTEALRRSLEEIIQRHSSLRTRIVITDGVPMQEVEEPREYLLEMTHVADPSCAPSDEEARCCAARFSDRHMDPSAAPLLGSTLLRVSASQHVLVLTIHRLIADCFSVDEVFRELWLAYPEFLHGRPSPLTAGNAQYVDYAQQQQGGEFAWTQKHAAYWEERLAGAVPIRWPVDARANGGEAAPFGEIQGAFGTALSTGLRDLARRERALAAIVMLSVYVAVVSRWCDQYDFVVPFNVAGRQSEHRQVIGYFSHVLYLRIQLTGAETFSELLGRVSKEFFQALAHDDLGRMVLKRPDLLSGTLFQWLSGHPDEHAELPSPQAMESLGLQVERFPIREFGGLTALPPAILDVEMSFFDTADGIYASGVYRADSHTPRTMQRFLDTLRSTSEQFVCNPAAGLASLMA